MFDEAPGSRRFVVSVAATIVCFGSRWPGVPEAWGFRLDVHAVRLASLCRAFCSVLATLPYAAA